MTEALNVLEKFRSQGVTVEVDVDGRLWFRTEAGPGPADLEAQLAAHGPALVELLRAQREAGA